MSNYWVLQANPTLWDSPETLYTQPIHAWTVTGVHDQIQVGDGVLLWVANRRPALRGLYAAGQISGAPRTGFPKGWGTDRQRAKRTWFAPVAIHWYLMHHPASVTELASTGFASNLILTMSRRTAYPATRAEFEAAIEVMGAHGPTPVPATAARDFDDWWDDV